VRPGESSILADEPTLLVALPVGPRVPVVVRVGVPFLAVCLFVLCRLPVASLLFLSGLRLALLVAPVALLVARLVALRCAALTLRSDSAPRLSTSPSLRLSLATCSLALTSAPSGLLSSVLASLGLWTGLTLLRLLGLSCSLSMLAGWLALSGLVLSSLRRLS